MSGSTGVLRGRDTETFATISLTGSTGRALSVVEIAARTIRFTGTLGQSVTLTLPFSPTEDRGRTYTLENATSGGFSITVQPVAGGNGVEIADGAQITGYYDGTDFIVQGGGAAALLVDVGGISTLYPLVITDPVIGDGISFDGTGQFVNTPPGAATMAIGSAVATGTAGSVLFVGAGGLLAQDNANLFWADATNRLGIGTNSPNAPLHVLNNSAATLATFAGNGLFSSVFFQLGNGGSQAAALRVYPGVDATALAPIAEMGGLILRGHYWNGASSQPLDSWWRTTITDNDPLTGYLSAGIQSLEWFHIRNDGQITLGANDPVDNPSITQPVVLGGLTFVTTDITFNALADLIFDTGTGSKIGTDAAQKMGFWGADPVVQQDSPTGTTDQKIDGLISRLETIGILGA